MRYECEKKKRFVLCCWYFYSIVCVYSCLVSNKYSIYAPSGDIFVYTAYFQADERLKWYLPEESFFVNELGHTVVYRVKERVGRFGKEYFVQEIQLDIYSENGKTEVREDGDIRVIAPDLEAWDNLVYKSNRIFADGDTVVWVNPKLD